MFKNYLLTGLVLILCHLQISAQSRVSAGRILDDATKQPVPFANILIKGTLEGTTSDSEGNFTLPARPGTDTLVISHVGYQTKEIPLTAGYLTVRMFPAAYLLEQVTVAGKARGNIEVFQHDKMFVALDYAFYHENVLLLGFRGRRQQTSLFLLNPEGRIITEKKLSIKADSLFEDCLGNVHLVTLDSTYQIYYDYRQLRLLYSTPRTFFMETMIPCKVSLDRTLVLEKEEFRGLRKSYYRSENGLTTAFFELSNERQINYIQRNYDLYYFIGLRNSMMGWGHNTNSRPTLSNWSIHYDVSPTPTSCVWQPKSDKPKLPEYIDSQVDYMTSVSSMMENLEELQANARMIDWLDRRITQKTDPAVLLIDNHLNIVDFEEKVVYRFDNQMNTYEKITLRYMEDNIQWRRRMWVDEATNEVYTATLIHSQLYIVHLDKKDFSELERIPVTGKLYSENMKIRGKKLYFIYSSPVEKINNSLHTMQL